MEALAFLEKQTGKIAGISIRRLATMAGVSYVTMWKAVRMRSRNSPRTAMDHRASLHQKSADPLAHKPDLAWQRLKRLIEVDILHGRLPDFEALPQIKELAVRYGVGFRTVREALAALCDDGLVRHIGRHYNAVISAARTPLTIGLLAHECFDFTLIADYDQYFVPALEQECVRRHVALEMLPYRMVGDSAQIYSARDNSEQSIENRGDLDGYVLPVFYPRTVNEDLFARLQATGKPIVIIDEIGQWDMPASMMQSGRALVIHARPYRTAARETARAIMARGHRHMAFFSPFHRDLWSHQCLEGLNDAVDAAGPGFALQPFAVNGSQLANGYYEHAHVRSGDHRVRAFYDRWKRSLPREYAHQLDPLFSAYFPQHLCHAEVRVACAPHFGRALADASITCWIAACSDTVWYAADFLRQCKSQVSLVGFGNSPIVTNSRITTYDFNPPAAARASLEFLLYPQRRLPGQKGIELEIQGMLIDRGSLGQA
jgi:DNA-binding LacI/PurR family transcriptional regulator